MNVSNFFLGAFAFGFAVSLVSFLADALHVGHFHPHLHQGAHGHAPVKGGTAASKLNFGTIAAFLVWFGGTGYILDRFTGLELVAILLSATVAGLAGGAIIFLFLSRVLGRNDRPLDPEDFRVVGMLGKVSSPIVNGGIGEMIGLQQGRRIGVPIRSESGAAIPTGHEVVVTRYEHGIAFVREWEEYTA